MKPEFTPEEQRLIARARHRSGSEAWGWLVVLLPLAAFAAYGFWRRDAIAVFVAWAGTALWLLRWIAASGRSSAAWRSILDKYAAADSAGDAGDGRPR